MLGFVRGSIRHVDAGCVLVDVGGMGYEVNVKPSLAKSLSATNEVSVEFYTHQQVREDAITLYGFDRVEERDMFRILIGISKIGPKIALAILTQFDLADLLTCVQLKDTRSLMKVPGIGAKTSTRLMMDLHDKLEQLGFEKIQKIEVTSLQDDMLQEAIEALVAMGFPQKDSKRAVLTIKDQADSSAAAIRLALFELST